MKVIIKREYDEDDKKVLKRSIRNKVGRYEKIVNQLKIKKCTEPEIGEYFLILHAIERNDGIEEETVIEDKKIFNVLTYRRVEILEILNEKGPLSIKDIKNITGRDYKNVYDDVTSLSNYILLTVLKYRKERVMIGKIKEFRVEI